MFRRTEVWPTPAPQETRILDTIGAGVTDVTGVQVTNSTGGELWLALGTVPPRSIEDADFVVPPRCTGNYPIDASSIAVRWNGQVSGPADSVVFAFTNQVVTPAVFPGVEPIALPPTTAPIERRWYRRGDFPTANITLTTPTGENVGGVFIYNGTNVGISLYESGLVGSSLYVAPYSWGTFPLNLPSGSPRIVLSGISRRQLFADASLFIAWSDTTYANLFAAGGGTLSSPATVSSAIQDQGITAGAGSIPFIRNGQLTADGTHYPISLAPVTTNDHAEAVLLVEAHLAINVVGTAQTGQGRLYMEGGIRGIMPSDDVLLSVSALSITGVTDSHTVIDRVALTQPVLLRNFSTTTSRRLAVQMFGFSGGGITTLTYNLRGYRIPA